MSDPKISVIIPVYNTAAYLYEAIESILKQSLKDIEVILINDGSTDESGDIIKRIATQDKRISYFEQSNQGQSVARNVGLQHATGEYIYCMDSDDIIDLHALELLYNRCQEKELELIFFDADVLYESERGSISWDYHRTHIYSEENVYQGIALMKSMIEHATHRAVPWLLLIKRSHLLELNHSFYPGIIHEDELFTTLLYLQSKRIGCLKKRLVQHRIRANSTMTNHYSLRNIIGYLTTIDQLFEYSYKIRTSESSEVIRQYTNYTLNRVFYTAHILSFKEKCSAFIWSMQRGYLRYVTIKTWAVFWLKRSSN